MNVLYNTGIRLYSGAARVAGFGSAKVRHMLNGQAETIARLESFRRNLAPMDSTCGFMPLRWANSNKDDQS